MKKNVVIGVCGGIAAYKVCELTSTLTKRGYNVKVIMTKNATEFVAPLTFETLSKNAVVTDMFAPKAHYEVEHISLAKWAGVFVVAPATQNVIAKLAEGIADDMLTTTFSASNAVKIICPAMNTQMYLSEANKINMETLKNRGVFFIEPGNGLLACGDVGVGRMEEPAVIADAIDGLLMPYADFKGKNILITAGATIEDIDGVRFISNYSSGKMGMAIADAACERGGNVTVVCGKVTAKIPDGCKVVNVKSTIDMYDAVIDRINDNDIFIMSAAPADYRVKERFSQKIKSETLTLEFVKNPDIAKAVGEKKGNKILVAFAAETNELLQNATKKLQSKNADIIVANDVTAEGAGFNTDTNVATLLYADGRIESLDIMPKRELADRILDGILSL